VIATLRRLLVLAHLSRARLAVAVLLGTLTIAFGAGLMATAGYLISRAAEQPAILSLTVAIVGVRFFGLARPLARYLERLAAHDLAFRVLGRVRVRFYERIEPLAPAELDGYRRGDLLSRMVADVDALQDLYLRGLGPILVALFASLVSVGVAAALLPAAALVLVAGLLLGGIVVPVAVGMLGHRAGRLEAPARGELSAQLLDVVGGAPELVVYGHEEESIDRLRARDRTLVSAANRAAFADGLGDGLRIAVMGATVVGVLAVSAAAHAAGDLDRVLIATLALLALASFEAVQPLPQAARAFSATLGAGRRVLDLSERGPTVVDPQAPVPAPGGPVTIALEGVRARYGTGGAPAVDDVSLRLEPGARMALVGPSGAGKTTVVNLLLRLLDPEQGRVTLGSRDIREYRQEDVRRTFAVAGQDAHLFSASIRENVRLARPEARDDEIETALRLAGIWAWARELPAGWDTLVGEQGRELSGGQRQRITLARALLANAHVLVLDEPTAHLDTETATRLMRDVFEAAGERSVLLITHRPEGLELVDEIVVLEQSSAS
jgi:ATP-binding cassette, subfamily C, bacterial CydC